MRYRFIALAILFPLWLCMAASPARAESAKKQATIAVVERALNAWKHENWAKMYSCSSRRDKEEMPVKQFIKNRRSLAIVERLKNYRIIGEKPGRGNKITVSIELTILNGPQTRFFQSSGWTPKKVLWSSIV